MRPIPTSWLEPTVEHLTSFIGSDYVHIEDDDVITLTPANTEQISAILAFATRNRLTISPQGGKTKTTWGLGSTPHIHLSLTRLNRLLEHPWQDLTCSVQAGCNWSKLQQTLALHGQFVALDPLFPEQATVGGILATNDSGALRHRYGSLRDLVIGMTLVLADGTVARTGGKVVKNVAGYDLCKLLTGSFGTLAVITEATFRLHSVPRHSRHFTIAAPSASNLTSVLSSIWSSQLLIQSLQLRSTDSGFQVDVQLNAHPEAHQESVLEKMVQREGLKLDDASEKVWRARETLFTPDATVLKVSTLPTQVGSYADRLQSMKLGVRVTSVSQAFGLHYISLQGAPESITQSVERLRTEAINSGITVEILQCGTNLKAKSFQIPSAVISLMQSVKQQFDPDDVLNPGKFLAQK